MSETKQPGGGKTEAAGAPPAGDSPLGPLPDGIIDDTPLESFDEQSFLQSIEEDDQQPRFGAQADAEAVGLAIGGEEEEEAIDAPAAAMPEEIEALAVLDEPAQEAMSEDAPAAAPGEEGLDLGLDEIDLSAIEEVAEEAGDAGSQAEPPPAARKAAASEAPKLPKFMFDVSFDLPEVEAKEEPEPEPTPEPEPEVPPPPTFSEEELAAARQAGFADGQAAGYEQAMQSTESKIAQGVESVGLFLPELLGQRDRLTLAVANDAARLAHALVRRALPELNRRYGPIEIEAVVREALQTAIDQPRILIRVAPEIAERITGPVEMAAGTAGFAGRVTVVGDPALGPADVKLDWGDGGVERMAEQVWGNLSAIVARLVEGLEQDTRLQSVAVDSAA